MPIIVEKSLNECHVELNKFLSTRMLNKKKFDSVEFHELLNIATRLRIIANESMDELLAVKHAMRKLAK